ncbi:histidine kinase N-terminal 7TM domain-containing protein, partial [Candidatus Margulisiibacteriota bacterium]
MPEFLDLNSLIYLFAVAINLGLSVFIFSKDRRSEIGHSLGTLIFFVALWALCIFLLRTQAPAWLLFIRRLSTSSTSLIVASLLYFSFVFPKREQPLTNTQRVAIMLPGIIFALLSIGSSLLIRGYVIRDPGFPVAGQPVYGVLYPLAVVFYLTYLSWALFNLVKKFIMSSGRQKLQVFYVLFGLGTSGVAGVTTNLILPILGFPQYSFLGPPFTLVMAFFLVYAIVAYRFLGIEDFLSRGITYLALALAIVGTFVIIQIGNISFIPAFYIALFNLALGTLVFFQNRKSPINISFSTVIFIIAAWSFSIGMFLGSRSPEQLFLWSKIYYCLGILIPGVFLYFSTVFPTEGPLLGRFHKVLLLVPGVILTPVVLYTNLIIKEFYIRPDGIEAVIGPAYPYYFLYYSVFM